MALNVVSNAGPLMVFSKLIASALSKNALLLMDEEHGRDYARQKNLQVRGSLGILAGEYSATTSEGKNYKVCRSDPNRWINFCER